MAATADKTEPMILMLMACSIVMIPPHAATPATIRETAYPTACENPILPSAFFPTKELSRQLVLPQFFKNNHLAHAKLFAIIKVHFKVDYPKLSIKSLIMAQTFLTIHEAALLSNKSVQTIRRAIKGKKIKARKSKTPQGYNYMVDRQSLISTFELKNVDEAKIKQVQNETKEEEQKAELSKTPRKLARQFLTHEDLGIFQETMRKLIDQHEKDKENLFRLVKSFQDRMVVLENQVKMLEAPKKKWFAFWR